MKKNLYYEYRTWVLFWGIFLDGQQAVQKVLDDHNKKGWTVIQFEWGASRKFTLFKLIFIYFVTLGTLGLLSYWTGFTIIFEKNDTPETKENSKLDITTSGSTENLGNLKNHGVKLDYSKVDALSSLIKQQKGSLLGGSNREKIIDLTTELCETKAHAELILQYYDKNFNKDLIQELKSLTSSYDSIRSYVYPFIQVELIDEKYPHDRIK